MSRVTIIIVSLLVAIAAVTAFSLWWTAGNNVGDAAKLERVFTDAERALIAERTIGVDELAAADGRDGHPAWVAVNGVVYDLTGREQWRTGRHHGVRAGTDATQKFVGSDHAVALLQGLRVVGGYSASG